MTQRRERRGQHGMAGLDDHIIRMNDHTVVAVLDLRDRVIEPYAVAERDGHRFGERAVATGDAHRFDAECARVLAVGLLRDEQQRQVGSLGVVLASIFETDEELGLGHEVP